MWGVDADALSHVSVRPGAGLMRHVCLHGVAASLKTHEDLCSIEVRVIVSRRVFGVHIIISDVWIVFVMYIIISNVWTDSV